MQIDNSNLVIPWNFSQIQNFIVKPLDLNTGQAWSYPFVTWTCSLMVIYMHLTELTHDFNWIVNPVDNEGIMRQHKVEVS